LGVGIWHTRASSDAIGDKLAAARLNIELSKLAREKTEADAVAQKAKAELRRAEAEARAAEFEADAAKAKTAAEAEAAAHRSRTELAKAAADVESTMQRTKAEAVKAKAEAEAAAQRTKTEAARARKAEAEAEAAVLDAAARKSAGETFLGRQGLLSGQAMATIIAAFLTVLGLLVTYVLSYLRDRAQAAEQAEAMHKFERRRIDAIKKRICSCLPATTPKAAATAESDDFPRPEALKALEYMSTKAGIYMVVGPKGEGKSTLISQFVSSYPHVLYVDLQDGSMDKAVRSVAAALSYDMTDSTDEASARQRGFKLPDLQTLQSTDMYESLLKAFEIACIELRSAGKLVPGYSPVLVLDHANRPLRRSSVAPIHSITPALDASTLTAAAMPVNADVNLMYSTVEIGHRFANKSIASLVMVSSDLLQELDAWRRAGGRDSVRYIRVAPFSDADAADLLARRIFASRVKSGPRQPTPEDLAAIQREYASTISTITLTIGTRARWLVQSLQHVARAPFTDAELVVRGVPIPTHYHPYLPIELRGSDLRVDPGVWVALQSLIEARKGDANALLNVSGTFSLPPSSLPDSQANRFAERIVAVDSALRALLVAPVPYPDLEKSYFASAEHVLRRLAEQHVIFYNHDTKNVEMESPLVHRVVNVLLSSKDHELSVQLVRQLLEWQTVTQKYADLKQRKSEESRSWFKSTRALKLERDLDAAHQRLVEIPLQVETTRASLRELRP